jgi:hypothetical protein
MSAFAAGLAACKPLSTSIISDPNSPQLSSRQPADLTAASEAGDRAASSPSHRISNGSSARLSRLRFSMTNPPALVLPESLAIEEATDEEDPGSPCTPRRITLSGPGLSGQPASAADFASPSRRTAPEQLVVDAEDRVGAGPISGHTCPSRLGQSQKALSLERPEQDRGMPSPGSPLPLARRMTISGGVAMGIAAHRLRAQQGEGRMSEGGGAVPGSAERASLAPPERISLSGNVMVARGSRTMPSSPARNLARVQSRNGSVLHVDEPKTRWGGVDAQPPHRSSRTNPGTPTGRGASLSQQPSSPSVTRSKAWAEGGQASLPV